MKKRILSILLAMCMLMSLLPVAAFAADGEGEAAGENGIYPAILHDTRTQGAIADGDLIGDDYAVTPSTGADGAKILTISGTDLKWHQNGDDPQRMGYWVGVAFVAPANATGFKYSTDGSDTMKKSATLEQNITKDNKSGVAFYFDAGAAREKTVKLQWTNANAGGEEKAATFEVQTYTVKMDGIRLAAPTKANVITPAILHDTTGAVPDSALNTSYKVETSGANDEDLGCYVTTINVSATALKPQANAQTPAVASYWTGFAAVPHADYSSNVNKMKVATGKTATELAANWAEAATGDLQGAVANGKSGLARYYASTTEEKLKQFNGRLVRVQWYENTTPVGEPETYKLNFDGVKFDPIPVTIASVTVKDGAGTQVVESIRASVENGVITLTGAMPAAETAYTLVCTTSAGGSLAVKATITPAEGETAASCVIAKATGHDNVVLSTGENANKGFFVVNNEYTVSITGLKSVDATIVPPAATGSVTIPNVSDETKTALEAVMNSTQATGLTALVVENNPETPESNASEVTTALAEAEIDTSGKTVAVVVQPYLDIQATEYVATATTEEPKSLTLEIDAKYRTVATTATSPTNKGAIIVKGEEGVGQTANAAVVGRPTSLTVDDSIDISVTLPNDFAEDGDIYVKHVKNNNNYFYKGTVSSNVATFTSIHGLSPFTFYADFTPKAQIGDTYFESLQDAVDAVQNGQVITALDDGTATVSKEVSFTVVPSGHTVTITVGSGYKNNSTAPSYNIVKDGGGSTSPGSSGGGGSSSSVSVPSASNGKVTVSNNNAKKGDTVTITLTPNTGYVVDTVTVTDSKGNTITVTKTDDTHYTFVMPEGRVTVKATFKQADAPTDGFTDVAADAYYADAVKWAVEKEITNGLTATTFGPNNSCTRGQMVTFLWRAAGSPAATGTNSFSDVASGEYYYDAVLWAVEKGITKGTTATTFSPNATVNRGQTVTFLYRYAESPAVTGDSAFTDVAADAYYADAVKWAVAEEITNGTSATTFAPASNCTRGQIVTFLYRQMAE